MNVRRRLMPVLSLLFLAAIAAGGPGAALAAEQPSLVLTASPTEITSGASTTLTVSGAPAGALVTLSRRLAGDTDFKLVGSTRADAAGTAAWTRTPPRSGVFRVESAGDDVHEAASAEVSVGVRPRIVLTAVAPKPLVQGRYVRYTVQVRPRHPGAPVWLARRTADGWEPFKRFRLNGDSRRTVRVAAAKPGQLVVRAEMAADADHLAWHSRLWRVKVFSKRNPYGVPSRYPHLILVDLSQYKLYYHERGNVVRVFKCVLGRPGLPTPRGRFRIYAKDPRMSGPYGPHRMRYLGLFAIHGTNEPWLLDRFPRNYSHGCTRLSNADIVWLYKRVPVGTPVWNVP